MKKNDKAKKQDSKKIDFSTHFAVAICIGRIPEAERPLLTAGLEYTANVLEQLSIFDHVSNLFMKEGIGSEIARDAEHLWILCALPLKRKKNFAESLILPLLQQAEKETGESFLCGVGIPAVNQLHLDKSVSSSKDAFDFFFFEQQSFFEYQKSRKHFNISFEEYEEYSEKAFKAILLQSANAIDEIDRCIDLIGRIHYGNKNAVIMRAMNYTGEMAYRLHRYNFLDRDFYELQDSLQEKVLSSMTFSDVKKHIHKYYEDLLADISSKSRTSRKTIIEQVKTYIRENYMTPLSVKELADLACVSPGYFSHMFKNETGESFKTYLTNIRLNMAHELLLGADYRLYEISEKVGYNNVRNFEEAFKKKYGSYPGDYKKQIINKKK